MCTVYNPKKILIVEDHPLVADATRSFLSKLDVNLDISICGSVESALKTFHGSSCWDRIFLDVNMPNVHGLSLIRSFYGFGVAGKCAVITAYDNALWRSEVQAMGMLGYIVKATHLEDFSAAIHDVLRGRRTFPKAAAAEPLVTRLTRRQQDILYLLYRGLASKEISAQLGLTIGTVNNHVTGLLRALDVTNRTHAIAKAFELGYLHGHDSSLIGES